MVFIARNTEASVMYTNLLNDLYELRKRRALMLFITIRGRENAVPITASTTAILAYCGLASAMPASAKQANPNP